MFCSLCTLCSSIDFVAAAPRPSHPQLSYKHHKSIIDLEISANNGCQLCQVLFRQGAQHAIRSRGTAQKICSNGLVDLNQIYYATWSTAASHYAGLPLHGVTEIQFFREGERFGERRDGFFVSLEPFAQHGNRQFIVQPGNEANRTEFLAAKSGYILGRPIVENPNSEACYEQIHTWMRDCAAKHHAASLGLKDYPLMLAL